MFDYEGAKAEGYSDQEINGFLKFDYGAALQEGYSPEEIGGFLDQVAQQYEQEGPAPEKPELTAGRLVGKAYHEFKGGIGDQFKGYGTMIEHEAKRLDSEDPWETYKYLDGGHQLEVSQLTREYLKSMPEEQAFQTAIDEVRKRAKGERAVMAEGLQRIGKSEALTVPKKYEQSSGWVEDVVGGVAGFGSTMATTAAIPAAGMAQMYLQIMGGSYESMVEQGVDPDRAYVAASMNALVQAPLETAGTLVTIGALKNLFKGKAGAFVYSLFQSSAAEGLEEYLQKYPDTITNMYAANPDLSADELRDAVFERITSAKFQKEAGYEASIGAGGGALMVGIGGGVKAGVDLANYKTDKQKEIDLTKEIDLLNQPKKDDAPAIEPTGLSRTSPEYFQKSAEESFQAFEAEGAVPADTAAEEQIDLLNRPSEKSAAESAMVFQDAAQQERIAEEEEVLQQREEERVLEAQIRQNEGGLSRDMQVFDERGGQEEPLMEAPEQQNIPPVLEAGHAQEFLGTTERTPEFVGQPEWPMEGVEAPVQEQPIITPTPQNLVTTEEQLGLARPIVEQAGTQSPLEKAPAQLPQEIEPETEIDVQANEAASSVLNDKPEPTEAQIDADNYEKGHIDVQGLKISIENPHGSTRKDKETGGEKWQTTMVGHYGDIMGTEGAEGDRVDVFVKKGLKKKKDKAYVIDQIDPETGEFDEHKVMLGYSSKKDAREGYLANYEEGWTGLGNITAVPVKDLKAWLKKGKRTEAFAPVEKVAKKEPGEMSDTELYELSRSGKLSKKPEDLGTVYHVTTEDAVSDVISKGLEDDSHVSTRKPQSDALMRSINRMNSFKTDKEVIAWAKSKGVSQEAIDRALKQRSQIDNPEIQHLKKSPGKLYLTLIQSEDGIVPQWEQLWSDISYKFIGKKPVQLKGKFTGKIHKKVEYPEVGIAEERQWSPSQLSPEAGLRVKGKDVIFDETPPTDKAPTTLKDVTVKVKGIREKTGEVVSVDENAETALKDIEDKRGIYEKMLNCLGS